MKSIKSKVFWKIMESGIDTSIFHSSPEHVPYRVDAKKFHLTAHILGRVERFQSCQSIIHTEKGKQPKSISRVCMPQRLNR